MSFKVKDYYFKKAKKENYLARSVYKLEEIDKKFSVLNQGNIVLDLGYHPGSWIQYVLKKITECGQVVGVDIKPINKKLLSNKNLHLFQKDIFSIKGPKCVNLSYKVDVLLSDMAPNTTGIKSVDQDRSCELVEKVFEMVPLFLKDGGNLVIKVFDGNDVQKFLKSQRLKFEIFKLFKPKSTRSISKEFFVIGKGWRLKN